MGPCGGVYIGMGDAVEVIALLARFVERRDGRLTGGPTRLRPWRPTSPRHWHASINGRPFDLTLISTSHPNFFLLCGDYEDEAAAIGSDPMSYPFHLSLCAGRGREEDDELLDQLLVALAKLLNGVSTPVES